MSLLNTFKEQNKFNMIKNYITRVIRSILYIIATTGL